MPLTGSLGAYQLPGLYNNKNLTPKYGDFFQTSGSGATQGMLEILDSATASDEWAITFLNVWLSPTANAYATVYVATTAIAAIGATITTNYYPGVYMNFGPIGLIGGTTTTSTVYVITAGATATINFVCQGYKRL